MNPRARLDPLFRVSREMPTKIALRAHRKICFFAVRYLLFASPLWLFAFSFLIHPRAVFGQVTFAPMKLPPESGEVSLEADQQHQAGRISYADGNVDIHYQNARLRADHVQYDGAAQTVA